MKLLSKAGATGTLALLFVLPVMACLTPEAQLTAEEKTCCRKMAGQCGQMGMDSGHSCCDQVLPDSNSKYLSSGNSHHQPQLSFAVLPAISIVKNSVAASSFSRDIRSGHSPPSHDGFQILRI